MNLTNEQLEQARGGQAVEITGDGEEFVLIRKDVYEQVRELIDDAHPGTMKRHLARIMHDDWSDPAMDVYNQFRRSGCA